MNVNLTAKLSKTTLKYIGIENLSKGVALHLRRICNSDEKFEKHVLYAYRKRLEKNFILNDILGKPGNKCKN